MDVSSSTRFAALGRTQAYLVLTLVFVLMAGGLAVSWGVRPQLTSGKGQGDLALYAQVIQRVRHGETYYDALGQELRARDYPMRSPFNWRTPLHLEVIAHLPEDDWARYLLVLAALGVIVLSVARPFRRAEYGTCLWEALLLAFPLTIAAMRPIYLFAEVWAGICIALSIRMYALGWAKSAAGTGMLALFFRELALPYVLISLVLACRRKNKSELWIWIAGLAGFAAYFGLHAMSVAARIPGSGHAPEISRWIQFGGLRFILITCRLGLLLGFPFWWAALYLPFALLGLAGWRDPVAGRTLATVAAYLLAFNVIGIPSANFYWGAIYAPLLAFGTPWALAALKDLVWAVLPSRWTAAADASVPEAA